MYQSLYTIIIVLLYYYVIPKGRDLSSPKSTPPVNHQPEVPSTPPLDYVIRGLLCMSASAAESPVATPRATHATRADGGCIDNGNQTTPIDVETTPTDEESLTYISCGNNHCHSTAPLHVRCRLCSKIATFD